MIDLALAKLHCRVDGDAEDTLIASYLAAAKAWVENHTGRKLTRGEVVQEESAFGAYVPLFWGPSPTDVTVTYTGSDDVAGEIADARQLNGRLWPGASGWPSTADNTAIVVTYTAGYETTPADLDAAVLLLTGDFYANREAGAATPATTAAVEALCRPYRAVMV